MELSDTLLKLIIELPKLKVWLIEMKNKRKVTDRRTHNLKQDQEYRCNRRVCPCRRLNNISAEWIPMDAISRHQLSALCSASADVPEMA